jgi:hypothetical protein
MLEILSNDPKTKPVHMAAVLETREPRVAAKTGALCTGTWSANAVWRLMCTHHETVGRKARRGNLESEPQQ